MKVGRNSGKTQGFPRVVSGLNAVRMLPEGCMAIETSSRKIHFGRVDRRSEGRIACEGETVIDVLSPQPKRSIQARIVDVGEASVKLSVPVRVSPGALIRIHMSESVASGEARYCTCEGAQYYIGVRIDEVAPKSN